MSGSTLWRLLGFLRPLWGWVVLAVLTGVVTVLSGIGLLGVSAYLIAAAALQPSIAALQVAIVGVRFLGINRAIFRYLERLVSHSVNLRLLAQLRVWFYRALEPLAPARLQDQRSASLLSRAVADIETLENFFVRAVAPPLVALAVAAAAVWFIGRYDIRLGIALALALALAGLVLPLLLHRLNRAPGAQLIDRRAELNAALLDAVQGMPDLLAFGQADRQLERISAAGQAVNQSQRRIAWAGALANGLLLLVTGLALWAVLLLAIPLVGTRIDGVTLAVLALVVLASFEASAALIPAAQHLESSLQSARRLFDLVDAPPAVAAPPNALPPPDALDIQVIGLGFRYPGTEEPALVDFSLDLPQGRHIALVGASGAGKTTLINLLLRFWEYEQGQVLLNGEEIRRYDPEALRQKIAVVSQSTYLFSATLRQNLLIAQPAASPADLDLAVCRSQLSEVVAQLPQGLDTWVGERGLQLSGGERQRLAVARALLRDARLLLLDEPAAHLDAANERRLLTILRAACAGRSLVYITHHLAGLDAMDEILVLQGGRVAERGTHHALLAAGGLYRRMIEIQSDLLSGG